MQNLRISPIAVSLTLSIAGLATASTQAPQDPVAPANPPGVQQLPGPDPNAVPASRPAMPPEEIAARFADQITGLAGRAMALRKLAGLGNPQGEPTSRPQANLDDIRRFLGMISKEIHLRAHPIELRVASTTAVKLAETSARAIPPTTVKPAPELKRPVAPNVTGDTVTSRMPPMDPTKATDVVFKVGSIEITRGELESHVQTMAHFIPEWTADVHCERLLRSAIIPLALRRANLPANANEVMQKAKTLRDEIAAGKRDFEATARELSDDPSTKPTGGLCDGWKPQAITAFELATVAKLKPGEISEPFIITTGVEFIQLIELQQNPSKMSDSSIKMRRLVLSFKLENDLASLLKNANIEVYDPAYEPFLPGAIARTIRKK